MTKEAIDQKYLELHSQLGLEFFDIVDEDLPTQHRVLKAGKSIGKFNLAHGELWRNHEAELIAGGFMEAPPPPLEPVPPFEPPPGVSEKVGYIEQFLKRLYG